MDGRLSHTQFLKGSIPFSGTKEGNYMSNIKTITAENFDAQVLRADGIVLVEFGASWCAPCKALGPILEKLSTEITNPIYQIDIDECQDLVKTHGIRSVPTVAAFKGGKIIGTKVGLTNKEALLKLVAA